MPDLALSTDTTNTTTAGATPPAAPAKPADPILTLAALATALALPLDFLKGFGLGQTKKGIFIPYLHQDGSKALRDRLRKGLSEKDGYRWTGMPKDPIAPYGLWRLRAAREASYLVLITSESDWWTLTFHNIPGLALPGPHMTKLLALEHLDQLDRVYIVRRAGDTSTLFARRVFKRLEKIGFPGELFIISLPEGMENINDLHRADPGQFEKVLREAIEVAEPFPDPGSQGDPLKPGLTKVLADAVSSGEYFARDPAGRLFRFENGVYRPGAEFWVSARVKALLEQWDMSKFWGPRKGDSVAKYLLLSAPLLWEVPPVRVVNVKNGLLRLDDLTLMPHNPAHLSTIQIPIDYNPTATCPAIDQFIREVFPDDARELPFEILGDLLTTDRSIQKAILLVGGGGNGKSVFLNLVAEFIGRENVSAISLHKLETDRFASAQLYGKLANIVADLPSEHLAGTSVFKSITGGDELSAEFKFKDAFKFRPFVRLIFSANHLPQSKDSSKAFFDRWIIVPFPREFRGSDREVDRRTLDAKLASPEELSGALNKAVAAVKRLRERGRFTESPSTIAARAELVETTDPLAIWLTANTVTGPNEMVLKSRLLQKYNFERRLQELSPVTAQAFGLALDRLRPGLEEKQRTIDGKRQWVYIGIGLEGEAKYADDDEAAA